MKNDKESLERAIARGLAHENDEVSDGLEAAIAQTSARYAAGMKKVGRIMALYLCGFVWFAVWAMYKFGSTKDVKGLIAWGLVFLIGIENTVLIKLWYWIMNTKIDLLKEMKTLRYEMAGIVQTKDVKPFRIKPEGISRKEQAAWFVLLVVVSAAIGFYFVSGAGQWFSFTETLEGTMGSRRIVTLHEDGSAVIETDYSFPNESVFPMKSFSMFSGDKDYRPVYTDLNGNVIPYDSWEQNDGVRVNLQLPEPIDPGERLLIHSRAESPNGAVKDGDEWKYWSSQSWGYAECEYTETVVFPKGAEVTWTSRKPTGKGEENQDGNPFYVYRKNAECGAPFEFTVKYRLE